MSRHDLQEKLLQHLADMRRAAQVTTDGIIFEVDPSGKMFHQGRVTAFDDCIRELEKAIEEAK